MIPPLHRFVALHLASGLLLSAAFATSPSTAFAAQPESTATQPLARIGGTVISEADLGPEYVTRQHDLERDHARRLRELEFNYRESVHETLSSAVDKLVDARVLALEAKDKHTTPAALLAAVPVSLVTPEEAHKVYDAHAQQIGQPYAAVEKPLLEQLNRERKDAAQRAYYHQLRKTHAAAVLVEPQREKVAADGPARGPAYAPVTILLFSDFECPYCAQVAPTLSRVLAARPGEVRLVYRHLPLTGLHPHAYGAAEAAVCASRQGKFWELYDAMFADQAHLAPDDLRRTAVRLGVDEAAYSECLRTGKPGEKVDADVAASEEVALTGTPAMLVNGRLVHGAQSYEKLIALVDDEIERIRTAAH